MTVTWKNYKIEQLYVIINEFGQIHDEYADRKEAQHYLKEFGRNSGCHIEASCAEWINEDGDLNPAVIMPTMTQAMAKLKKILG